MTSTKVLVTWVVNVRICNSPLGHKDGDNVQGSMLDLGKNKELSRTENEEGNFQRMAFWRKAVFFCCHCVVYLFFFFWDRESHISSKRGQTTLGQETKSTDRWRWDQSILRAVLHLDYSSEDIRSADIASLSWPDKKQSKNHRCFSVRHA